MTTHEPDSFELSTLRFESLDDSGAFGLRRGFDADQRGRVLLSVATHDALMTQVVEQFERCVAISRDLDPALFVRSLAVEHHEGMPALVMQDPGGVPLSSLLDKPVSVGFALNVALDVAASLADFHGRGLIHRDVKPSNVLVDPKSGKARLSGFRMALRLPRHRQPPEAPERLVGSLPYMAPEQSGWTNRSIDNRSDLYSLGIVLYEMLAGRHPFVAADLAEWVHCHIARYPTPPHEVDCSIPRLLSAIVMRLIAKNPDERYQTAGGLVWDLSHCLISLTPAGAIPEFAIGSKDIARHLVISEKLYGRESEVTTLVAGFDRAVETQRPVLLLVTGPSGIGKTSVIAELQKALVPARGRFVSGKCDQYKRDIPYAALREALRKLVSSLLGESASVLAQWKTRFLDVLADVGSLISALVPEIELIVGELPPAPILPAKEAQFLIQTVLGRFIGLFSNAEHPLALFIDDLQWLDVATTDLLGHILEHEESGCLLLIGAYRSKEVGPEHAIHRRLETLGANPATERLELRPLSLEHITELVAGTTRAPTLTARPLAAILEEKAGGNPFFVVQLIKGLAEEGLITLDERSSEWRWDLRSIVARTFERDVLELMAAKIARLPEATREALGTLAAFGAVAAPELLAALLVIDVEAVHAVMHEADLAGLVRRFESGAYGFVHDRFQEAAYALVAEAERAPTHLRLGRLLLARTPLDTNPGMVFEVVNQLNRGVALMSSQQERDELIALDMAAGRRAHAAAAFDVALTYFVKAGELLGEEGWISQPGVSFEAEYFHAECELLNGESHAAETRLASLVPRTTTLEEYVNVLCLRLIIAEATNKYLDGVTIGLAYFARAGVSWPEEIKESDIEVEIARVHEQVAARGMETLAQLPMMTDPVHLLTMRVLSAMWGCVLFGSSIAVVLVASRGVNLSIEFGVSEDAPLLFGVFGQMMMKIKKRNDVGLAWAELALALVEERGFKLKSARAYVVAGHVMVWNRDLALESQLGARGLLAGIEQGDLGYAAVGYAELTRMELARGTPLASAERLILNAVAFCRKWKMEPALILGELNVIRALRGGAFDFAPHADEAEMERSLDDPSLAVHALCTFVRKLERNVYLHRPADAFVAAKRAEQAAAINGSFEFQYAELQLHGAIARAMVFDTASAADRPALRAGIQGNVELLRTWALTWAPTFEHRRLLAEAELARIEGRHWDAQGLYNAAIRTAHEHGWIHHEALANERAARFFLAHGFDATARMHFANAHRGYLEWGAVAKAKLLEPFLPLAPAVETSTTLTLSSIDLATVLKVSNALSGEIVLDKLVEQLLTIAVEHAGASRALLFTVDGAEPHAVAEALTTVDGIHVSLRVPAKSPYPASMVRWVLRTREALVLMNPLDFEPFSQEAYLRIEEIRSVVILPLSRQASIGGILYLENRLAGGAFRESQLSVLQLVAAQAAIALDNARLYEQLQRALEAVHRSEDQLRTTLDAMPEMTFYNRLDGTNEFQSEVWRAYTGLTHEETSGDGWLSVLHPEDRVRVIESWARIRERGDAAEVEARLRRHDGVYRWFVFRVKPRRDAEGHIVKWYGNTVDIEDLKQSRSALVALQSQLAHVSRVASLGALSASITHEVNQPLSGIQTNAFAAKRWLESSPPVYHEVSSALERIHRDALRMGEVVTRLRSLFLKQDSKKIELSINETIREVIELIHVDVGKGRVALHTSLAPGIPRAFGNPVQLQQVILNLINNAVQAIGPEKVGAREIIVSTRAEGQRVIVSIADTGPGFAGAEPEMLFEPFQSTKSDGMGIGLSICRTIMTNHGGRIWAETNDRGGATFRFSLPASRDAR